MKIDVDGGKVLTLVGLTASSGKVVREGKSIRRMLGRGESAPLM